MPTTKITQGLDLTGSGIRLHVRTITASETLRQSDHKILVDCTAGAVTITLPAATTLGTGFTYKIQKIDATSNAVTIDGNGAETIDGAVTKALTAQYGGCEITVSGSAWYSFGSIPAAVNQTWTSNDAGATGVVLTTDHASASPANSDVIFRLDATGRDNGTPGASTVYGRIQVLIIDPVDGTEDGLMRLAVMKAGTVTNILVLDAIGCAVAGLLATTGSVAGGAGVNIPHGTAPSSPVNGDLWSTTAGLFFRANGVTVGPLS